MHDTGYVPDPGFHNSMSTSSVDDSAKRVFRDPSFASACALLSECGTKSDDTRSAAVWENVGDTTCTPRVEGPVILSHSPVWARPGGAGVGVGGGGGDMEASINAILIYLGLFNEMGRGRRTESVEA